MEERRRCKRLPMNIPVKVYGRTPDNRPFRDVTVTKYVNSHGALLPLTPRVKRGQTVLLVNSFTGEERECRVVYVDGKRRGTKRVAVEFTNLNGDFWHVFTPMIGFKSGLQSPQVA
ncbi:MAG: PilZ domain-containing protein [Blastocatellia bacterium]